MAESPVVYLFYGDDERAMLDEVAAFQTKLGDATTASMNTTQLEGSALTLDAVRSSALAAPFLATKRLVVTKTASKVFSSEGLRKQFIELLDTIPAETRLVLLEVLAQDDLKRWDKHWLNKWASTSKDRVYIRQFLLPKGAMMAAWIRQKTKDLGGEIDPQAASDLAELVGSNKEAAQHEIEKLLAHAAFQRAITPRDVEKVSLIIGEQGDFFALIDSLTSGQTAKSMEMLEDLLMEREPIVLFFSLVSHFRLLLQAREIVDTGRGDVDIARELGIHPYRAEKLAAQARRFTMSALEAIYQRLVDLDLQIKTGEIEPELAIETFVANLTAQVA
jgi:DNA polymerase-3 subunit delta